VRPNAHQVLAAHTTTTKNNTQQLRQRKQERNIAQGEASPLSSSTVCMWQHIHVLRVQRLCLN